jgi:hypothetical protein
MLFADIQQVATITCREAVRYEQNVPLRICRKPIVYLKDAWPMLRSRAFLNN